MSSVEASSLSLTLFSAPSPKLIINSSELDQSLKAAGLDLKSQQMSLLCEFAQKQFQQMVLNESLFDNVKKSLHPHLPKMHCFYNPTNKLMRLYIKMSKHLKANEGSIKAFAPAISVTFSIEQAPVVQKVARLKIVKELSEITLNRFKNEIVCLNFLKGNPLICQLLDFAEYKGKNGDKFILYECLYDGSLVDLQKILPTEQAERLSILKKIFELALRASIEIHNRNIVHRDLKLSNILFKKPVSSFDLSLVLADFDLARKMSELEHDLSGTATYFAPEHLLKGDLKFGKEIDYWALGCVFHKLYFQTNPPWSEVLGGLCHLKNVVRKNRTSMDVESTSLSVELVPSPKILKLNERVKKLLELTKNLKTQPSSSKIYINEIGELLSKILPFIKDDEKLNIFKKGNPNLFKSIFEDLKKAQLSLEKQLRASWSLKIKEKVHHNNCLEEIIHRMLIPGPSLRLSDTKALELLLSEKEYELNSPIRAKVSPRTPRTPLSPKKWPYTRSPSRAVKSSPTAPTIVYTSPSKTTPFQIPTRLSSRSHVLDLSYQPDRHVRRKLFLSKRVLGYDENLNSKPNSPEESKKAIEL